MSNDPALHGPAHRWQSFGNLPAFSSRRKILRRDLPLLASFKLTYRCNLRCAPCPYHRRDDHHRAHIRWESATAALDALHRAGCRIVVFEGGEPLLWSDGTRTFSDLARYARDRFLCTAATTNGTLPLDVPADVLWVSLDGTKETHDRLRSGSFDRVWSNLEQSLAQVKLLVHFTMNRENWRDLAAAPRRAEAAARGARSDGPALLPLRAG